MANPPSKDIVEILEQSSTGLGYTFGTNMFIGVLPDTPDECIAVYDTGGSSPAPNYDYYYPMVQVIVRGSSSGATAYKDTWDTIEIVKQALHGLHGETWNGAVYIQIMAMSDILRLGPDDHGRPLFSLNFGVHRTY